MQSKAVTNHTSILALTLTPADTSKDFVDVQGKMTKKPFISNFSDFLLTNELSNTCCGFSDSRL